jgi:diguanylate cyclase (GGDEF)-like protein/PAS domain S-box-containing protein
MKPKSDKRGGVEILIVEDSATQREQLQHLLEEHGYAVESAANGREALEFARRRKPTLIVSDIVMPELDGYGLCKAIKSDESLKEVPVVLLTSLSDAHDVIFGLECGADNFIRKPYQEDYLLQRIEYLLMNLELRKSQKMQMGVEINLGGQRHFITAERQQILDLLISTYEQATHINKELTTRERQLAHSNEVLNGLNRIADGLNRATSEREVAETALERALSLPGIQAGWISLREGESGFRVAAARNLPPALEAPGAMEGECLCRRRLLSGELSSAANILECERLGKTEGDTHGLCYHAAVPLWIGDSTLGVMNLVGPQEGLFTEDELKILYGVGNQVAVALERARLHEHMERLVAQRTSALTAEIAERKRIEQEQARLVAIIEATPDFVATGDLEGRTLYINQAGRRMIGFEPGRDVSDLRVGMGHPDWARRLVLETGVPYAVEHGTWSGETAYLTREGREIPVSQVIIVHKGPSGSVEYLSTIARDITERKEQEAKVARLNRVYAVLSGINTTIVRTRDRQALLEEACRIAVEQGGFRLAWIGLLDPNGVDVRPAAMAGAHEGYVDKIRFAARDDACDCCLLVVEAARRDAPAVCNDVATDARMARWREAALEHGFRSLVVFPLHVGEKMAGVFLLYAPEKDFFDTEEMKLLAEVAGDISFALDHIEKAERLNYLAYYDSLTGLANRALFQERLAEHLRTADQERDRFAACIFDVERFKTINDTLGRQAGDELLKQIGARMARAVGDPGRLARVSADGFALLLPDVQTGDDAARRLEHKLHACFDGPFTVGGRELRVSAKAGLALFPNDAAEGETLFANAEAAWKKAKQTGERFVFYTQKMTDAVAQNFSLENKLRQALENEEFVLYYQPKVDLETRRVAGVEALIRWQSPELGLVPPVRFIPLMEETGLILEAGDWALRQAVNAHRRWVERGLPAPRIAVNVSAIQLRQRDFVDAVRGAIGSGVTPPALDLELTESLLMEDIRGNVEKLKAMRALGVKVAIDDFGTGHSSLSYLATLPVDTLKIDRSFVNTMLEDPGSMALVQTIISLAHSLKLAAVAEGVETEEQARMLRLLRCDQMQGYLISKPLPFAEMTALLSAA